MHTDDTVDILNQLIEVSKDGEYGFRASAEQATSPALKTLLSQRVEDCRRAASELQQEVMALGGEAEDGGSASGALHRGWVSAKAKLARHGDLEILEEVERGEDKALRLYQKAAADHLPAAAKLMVARQLEGVRHNHDQIRALRDAARTKKAMT